MANRYWIPYNSTTSWNAPANWSNTSGILVTGSCTGTSLNISPTQGSLTGYSVRTSSGVSLGTITGGSGTNYTVSIGGTVPAGTQMVIYSSSSVPTNADNVFFDIKSNGATGTSPTVNITTTANCLSLDFTGFTGTFNISNQTVNVYGNLTMGLGMSYSATTGTLGLLGSNVGINTNGVTITGILNLNNSSGIFTLNSNLTCNDFRVTCSSFTTIYPINCSTFFRYSSGIVNVNTITCGTFETVPTGNRDLTIETSLTLTGSGSVLNITTSAYTTTISIPNVYLTNTTSASKTVFFSILGIDNIYIQGAGTGDYTINGTFTTMNIQNTGGAIVNLSTGATVLQNLIFSNTSTVNWRDTGNLTITGNITLGPNITITNTSTPPWTVTLTGTGVITSNGKQFVGDVIVNTSGTITINDSFSSSGNLVLNQGTIVSNGNVTVSGFVSNSSLTRALTMNDTIWTLTGLGFSASGGERYPWYISSGGTFTFSQGTYGEIKFTDTTNNPISFSGGSRIYGILKFARGASSGLITVKDAGNTFTDLTFEGTVGTAIVFPIGTTNFYNFRLSGYDINNILTIQGTTPSATGTVFNKLGGGIVWARNLNVDNIQATPATATWYASPSSCTLKPVTTGWILRDPICRLSSQGVG